MARTSGRTATRATPARQRRPGGDASGKAALGAILELVPSLFFKLKARTDALHAGDRFTTGERGVLRDLIAAGAMTVPELAALRPVSRQAIQPVLDRLLGRGLVEAVANPRHARSPRYQPTRRGRARMQAARRREDAALAGAAGAIPARDLEKALATMRRLETLLAATGDA